jgi:FMN reductase
VQVLVLTGNPKPNSRTQSVALALADRLAVKAQATTVSSIDLASHASDIFAWPDSGMDELIAQVAAADLLIAASPTYKATYSGLLKGFLDRCDAEALVGVVAIPLMTAGNPGHAMAVEVHLRPLLVELGASVPTRGLAFPMTEIEQFDQVLDAWVAQNAKRIVAQLGEPTIR